MYIDTINLLDRLKDYSSPKSKITTMVEADQITRIKRGIYIEDDDMI
jgi:hypothetical protein